MENTLNNIFKENGITKIICDMKYEMEKIEYHQKYNWRLLKYENDINFVERHFIGKFEFYDSLFGKHSKITEEFIEKYMYLLNQEDLDYIFGENKNISLDFIDKYSYRIKDMAYVLRHTRNVYRWAWWKYCYKSETIREMYSDEEIRKVYPNGQIIKGTEIKLEIY